MVNELNKTLRTEAKKEKVINALSMSKDTIVSISKGKTTFFNGHEENFKKFIISLPKRPKILWNMHIESKEKTKLSDTLMEFKEDFFIWRDKEPTEEETYEWLLEKDLKLFVRMYMYSVSEISKKKIVSFDVWTDGTKPEDAETHSEFTKIYLTDEEEKMSRYEQCSVTNWFDNLGDPEDWEGAAGSNRGN